MLPTLKKVIPIGFVTGAAMELFMIKTGFYEIVTNKEAERRLDAYREEESRRERLRQWKESRDSGK